jgi:uncharacterized protein (DUF342 family)
MSSGFHFKGLVHVSVDPVTVEARLRLEKTGDLEYDEPAIVKTIRDANIKEGFDLDDVLDAIQKFTRSKETRLEEVFARGLLPVPPTPQTFAWDESLHVPDGWKEITNEVLKQAGPPVLYVSRQEKKATETPPVVHEVKERVLVDPRVLKVFYAESGARLATIEPPRAGKPGRDLAGQMLPPPPVRESAFYLGAQIARKKGELFAEISGFVRVGNNWADLVAFEPHRWSLSFNADRSGAFLTFNPGNPLSPPVQAEDILKELASQDYKSTQTLAPAHIQAWLDEAVRKNRGFEARSLNPDRDASFEIEISPDRTKAFLNIKKSLGNGRRLVLKDLGQKLREAGLKGFSFENAKAAITDFLSGPATELTGFLLAEGKPPTRSGDRKILYVVEFLEADAWAAVLQRLASSPGLQKDIPYQELLPVEKVEKAAIVKKCQVFAVFQTPEDNPGQPGVDVFGEPLPPIPGNDPLVRILQGAHRSGDGIEALEDGILEVLERDGVVWMRVREHVDAEVQIVRSPDNLEATMTLTPSRATGRPLDIDLIHNALAKAQVCYGLDNASIEVAFKQALSGKRIENAVVARGVPSSLDFDHRLKFLVATHKSPNGRISGPVHEGEVVAEYWLPDPSNPDGVDVLGNVIPVEQDSPPGLRISENLKIEPLSEDHQKIIAQKSGEFVWDHLTLLLKSQVVLKNVDSRSGNIKFTGEVLIEGGVESGVYIMAGSVKVRGLVGAALLSSETNIQVAEGIKGDGKALLRAKKHIAVGFAERTTLLAVGDLYVNKSLSFCRVMCNSRVLQKTPGGTLVGGIIKVKGGLVAHNLGSPNGVPTTISFGQDYLIEDQINAEVKETDKLREAIVKLDQLMLTLTGDSNKDKLAQARQKKVLMLKMLEKRNLKLINLRDKFDLHCASEILIHENIFPGVSIESHGRLFEVKTKKSRIKIVFNENTGHIEEQSLE